MTDDRYEKLSALLDDELSEEEMLKALDEIEGDPALLKSWDHYSLIGDVIRGESSRRTIEGVSARISEAIANEPAIIAQPQRKKTTPKTIVPSSISEVRWLRPMAGAAIAATVAVAAVYVSPIIQQAGELEGVEIAGTSESMVEPKLPAGNRWKNLNEPGVASKLDQYLREHSEYSSPGGMGGVLPYASFVSYDNTRP